MERLFAQDELLEVKFSPPALPSDMLVRAPFASLVAHGDYGLITVVAPAGYGKSTALSYLYEQRSKSGASVAWFHVDSYDDSFGFWRYFCGALRRVDPDQDFSWIRDVAASAGLASPLWTNRLINQIETIDAEFTLIIDDFQLITDEDIHAELEHVIAYMPPNMHLVIASREAIPFPLARLKLQQLVLELGKEDLTFSYDDTRAYLNEMLHLDTSAENASEIVGLTQGWIAGIKIIAMTLFRDGMLTSATQKVMSAGARTKDMRQIYEYLGEEVLRGLSARERAFLVQTAFLDTLSASLCDYVLDRTDSEDLLASFERANLFITQLNRTSSLYRLHPLFREFLDTLAQRDYKEERIRANRRAARWFTENGYPERSAACFISSGDFDLALESVEAVYWSRGAMYAYTAPVINLLSQVPFKVLCRHPRCLSFYIILLFGMGAGSRLDRCLSFIKQSGAKVFESIEGDVLPEDEKDRKVVQAFVAYSDDNYRKALGLFNEALNFPQADLYRTDGLLWIFKSRCHYALGEEAAVFDALAKSIDNARGHRMVEEYLMASCELARVKCEYGYYDESDSILRDALSYSSWHNYEGITNGIMHFALAASKLEQGRPAAIEAYLDEYREFITQQKRDFGGWICSPDFFLAVGECYYLLGDYARAEEFVICAKDYLKHNVDVAFLPERIVFLRICTWLMADEREKLEEWMRVRKSRRRTSSGPTESCSLLIDALVALACGDAQRTLNILEFDVPSDSALPLASFRIDYHVIKAFAYAVALDYEQARNQMAVALRLGNRGNRIQRFVSWGPWVAKLAQSVLLKMEEDGSISESFAAYVVHVADRCRNYWENAPKLPTWIQSQRFEAGVQLTKREREVLACLVDRKTAEEIAQDCYISLSTAQAHIHNIYRKLGVHDRVSAIEKGRRILGMQKRAEALRQPPAASAETGALQVGNLSVREAEVLKLMVEGKRNADIAEMLAMSEQTVRTHVKRIYRKMNVHSREQAVQQALASDDVRLG